ncbi:methionyl-tRNA formyltransferase [Emticicia soli]|uniref:Methionyl-tRNA formyltransferase n=1 Tax=Emticicia soli TaxID=2027878 RepID=A0ABW5J3R1_9BACT
MGTQKYNIALLISGNLGYTVLLHLVKRFNITAIFTDRKSTNIIDFSNQNKVPVFIGNPRNNKSLEFAEKLNIDIILSINYLFIIEKGLINLAKKYAVNFHGSLLPKYRGRTPHVWAIINGEKQTGITAHILTEGLDAGPILEQVIIPISDTDTGFTILEKYYEYYPSLVDKVLENIEINEPYEQDSTLATYFSKREPEDGKIIWDWHKERIYNWIRALAKPYPGAFFYHNFKKKVVHSSNYNSLGFKDTDANGLILAIEEDGIIIKTSNGAMKLFEIEDYNKNDFQIGEIVE